MPSSVSIEELIKALQASWAADTCFDASEWTADNPARGHCVASSLVVQNYLGGNLIRYHVHAPNLEETHYANILPDGTVLDTTAQQYKTPVTLQIVPIDLKGYPNARAKRLADADTRHRYELLLNRVVAKLAQPAKD